MFVVNGLIALALGIGALMHIGDPECAELIYAYAGGSLVAFLTLRSELSIAVARTLAIITTGLMFFYFAGFFSIAPELGAAWWHQPHAFEALSLLVAAFSMIPVLSDYSCRLKAECREARARTRRSFFSAPQNL